MIKVTIIIPIFKVEKYIKRCIFSVIKQNYSNIECILIDDCTQDKSMIIVNNILSNYNGKITFKIIQHKYNQGLSAARNNGILNANGDYLYFLDSDDYITSDCISTLVEYANKYNGIDIVQGNIISTDRSTDFLNIIQYSFPEYSNNHLWIKSNMLKKIPMTAWNKLIRKDFILDNNLFFKPNIIHEDEHWRFFACKYICSIAFSNKPTYYYCRNDDSIMDKKNVNKSCDDWLVIIKDCSQHIDNCLIIDQANFLITSLRYLKTILMKKDKEYVQKINATTSNIIEKLEEKKLKKLFSFVLLPIFIQKRKITKILFKHLIKKYEKQFN